MIKKGLLLLTTILILGCATKNQVDFNGMTHTNQTLRNDSYQMIKFYLAVDDCKNFDRIDASVLQAPTGPEGNKFSKELWIVSACGKTYKFEMSFTEDGHGGAYFSVKQL